MNCRLLIVPRHHQIMLPTTFYLYNLCYFFLVLLFVCSFGAPRPVALAGDAPRAAAAAATATPVRVGVILDKSTWTGNISWTCMEKALEDFYSARANYTTRLSLHLRDTGPDAVSAASAVVDLLKNVDVQAIIGSQTSTQAKFLAEIGSKSSVPIISFSATSPYRSSSQNPFSIHAAWNDSCQAEVIASLVQRYNWREVVPISENSDWSNGFVPDLVDALQQVDARVPYRCEIHSMATGDEISKALSNLKNSQTRVFVVHMSYALALRFFQQAEVVGMMSEGFVWITMYGLTDIFDLVGSPATDMMQGVLGVKPYVEKTKNLTNFQLRWRERYQLENPDSAVTQPALYGLYAYDTVWALAMAAERSGDMNSDPSLSFGEFSGSTDFDNIVSSTTGRKLRDELLKTNFMGLSGRFHFHDMQLVSRTYEIINIVGRQKRRVGFWTRKFGISGTVDRKADLDTITWPGGNQAAPRGFQWPTNGNLRIGVPVKPGFGEFVRNENGVFKGFCIDVFEEVLRALPYNITPKYVEFGDGKGDSNGTYDELVYQVYLKKYDAVVGDVTILANRSLYVDFALPYTESGVRMLVPVRDQKQKTAWTFLRPLTTDLWLGIGAFFVFTGFVIWFIEHRTNEEFRGPPLNQIGSALYFSFSTLVFAHKEKIANNSSRVAVVIWLFVVLILQQSYTASLSSMLTMEQLQPTVADLDQVIKNGSYVGYLKESFMPGLLKRLKLDESKLIAFNSPKEYNEALSNGKVAVIVDEIPLLKLFLSRYCDNYMMVGPTYKSAGFGFVFPRGSPLVADISRAILQVASSDRMVELENALYGKGSCPDKGEASTSRSLTFRSFSGLFLITGVSSSLALILHVVIFLYNRRNDLRNSPRGWFTILAELLFEGESSSDDASGKDDPRVTNVVGENTAPVAADGSMESPCSISNHRTGSFDSDNDLETPPDAEGNFRATSGPASFSDMLPERG